MSTVTEQLALKAFTANLGKSFEESVVSERAEAAIAAIVELSAHGEVSPDVMTYHLHEALVEDVEKFLAEDLRRASVVAKAEKVQEAIDILKKNPHAEVFIRAITVLERLNHAS